MFCCPEQVDRKSTICLSLQDHLLLAFPATSRINIWGKQLRDCRTFPGVYLSYNVFIQITINLMHNSKYSAKRVNIDIHTHMKQCRQWSLVNLHIWNVFWGCQIYQQMDQAWNYWGFLKFSRNRLWRLTGEWNVGLLTLLWHWAQIGRHNCQLHTPAALYPRGNSSLPICYRLSGTQV